MFDRRLLLRTGRTAALTTHAAHTAHTTHAAEHAGERMAAHATTRLLIGVAAASAAEHAAASSAAGHTAEEGGEDVVGVSRLESAESSSRCSAAEAE